jgi:hypothetical protein
MYTRDIDWHGRPAPACRHRSRGPATVATLGLLTLLFGWGYDQAYPNGQPAAKPAQPKVIVHTIIKHTVTTVHDKPVVSGAQVVLICAIIAVALVCGAALWVQAVRHRAG